MSKTALITGVTGQDGSYLAELLIEKDYEVHGVVRRTSSLSRSRLKHLYENPEIYGRKLFLHYADLDDGTTLRRLLTKVSPDEIYHLAGQSHVGLSFDIPESTCEMTGMATLRLLEIIRDLPRTPKLYHASSSEIFGNPRQVPQDEDTPFAPVNPYGCAKAFATQMVRIYRESFGLFACNGITYNHESPRRGENFVTRKICRSAAAIKLGIEKDFALGDLTAERDWGDARDYVRGMWLTLQHSAAEDFVFATGVLHSVQDIVEQAFQEVGFDWKNHLRQDERLMRRAEPHRLVGNPAKARKLLQWNPESSFESLIREMTRAEVAELSL
jgi:GDPmannose 4,6-dehydratase